MTDAQALQEMLWIMNEDNGAVLVAGKVHADLPTIQCVSRHDGARLKTSTGVQHHGFGLFSAEVNGEKISFDGGGAMRRAETFSWCRLIASTEALAVMGYDIEAAKAAITELINAPSGV